MEGWPCVVMKFTRKVLIKREIEKEEIEATTGYCATDCGRIEFKRVV